MIRGMFRGALVLGLLLVVALLAAVTTMHFAIHGAEVRVPDLRNLSEGDARRRAAADGLEISVGEHFYSAVVPAGRIVTQSPPPGTTVRTGWQVRLSQSLGAQKVAVPDVLHEPERAAALSLRRAGLQIGTIAHLPYSQAEAGTVIAQSPDAGSADVERPNVSLLLSMPLPPESTGYVMPDFVNGSAKAAVTAVARAGLKMAPPLYRQAEIPAVGAIAAPGTAPAPPAPPVMPGTVIAQQPGAGSRVDATAVVQLTLAQ